MPEAIASHLATMIGADLQHGGATYHIESDGLCNPQPTPVEFDAMRHFTVVFHAVEISEERADELEWPAEWGESPAAEAEEEAPVAPDVLGSPEDIAELETMPFEDLRSYAALYGVKGRSRADIIDEMRIEIDKRLAADAPPEGDTVAPETEGDDTTDTTADEGDALNDGNVETEGAVEGDTPTDTDTTASE